MWKRLMIVLIALLGTFTVAHTYYDYSINGTSTQNYSLDSSLYGKLGAKGIGPNGSGSIMKGDKLLLSTKNDNTGKPIAWQLLIHRGNEWMAISDSSYANIRMVNDSSIYIVTNVRGGRHASIDDSNAASYYTKLNSVFHSMVSDFL